MPFRNRGAKIVRRKPIAFISKNRLAAVKNRDGRRTGTPPARDKTSRDRLAIFSLRVCVCIGGSFIRTRYYSKHYATVQRIVRIARRARFNDSPSKTGAVYSVVRTRAPEGTEIAV